LLQRILLWQGVVVHQVRVEARQAGVAVEVLAVYLRQPQL